MKILIIEACLVNFHDDLGGQHQDTGAVIDVDKDSARSLTAMGRALYVEKKDDPSKGAHYTASSEMLNAAKAVTAARTRSAE